MIYDAKLVRLNYVRFAVATGLFQNNAMRFINDGTVNMRFRTIFHDVDYIGQPVPDDWLNLTGIVTNINGTPTITARFLDDFDLGLYRNEIDIIANQNSLIGNYPNPFNPETTIIFYVSNKTNTESVIIEIFNIRGQRVRQLLNEYVTAGIHNIVWDGRNDNDRLLGSGVYFYQMRTGNFIETRRMLLIK
jgi:hypothetical protein